jgi:hypothetical protein
VIYDVEVFNNELMSLGASDRARLMFESANSVVTQL